MRPQSLLIVLACLCMSFVMNAQNIIGYNTSNYAGISGIDIQPASIVDSRYKFDMTAFGFGFSFANNYLGFRSADVLNGSAFNDNVGDYREKHIHEFLSDKIKTVYSEAYIQMPSFMLNLGKNSAMAFTWRFRGMMNVDNLTPSLARIAVHSNELPDYWQLQLNNDGAAINAMGWSEFGLGFAQVVSNRGKNFFKVGGRLKIDFGAGAGYFYANDMNYRWVNHDSLDLFKARFGYGHSDNFELGQEDQVKINRLITRPSLAGDIGVVYEYRPDYEKYTYPMDGGTRQAGDENKYKLRLGASLVDIGRIRFIKGHYSDDFTADVRNWNVSRIELGKAPVKNIDDTLRRRGFFMERTSPEFNMVLPTALSFQVDYHIHRGFYANFTTYTLPRIFNDEHRLHALNYASLTARWESRWLGVYMPVTITEMGDMTAGFTLRTGPWIIGTSDFTSLLFGKYLRTLDIHFGLKIPILQKRGPIDRDNDGVSDGKDYCPGIKGTWANRGCPPKEPDRDGDNIIDKLDSCPDIAGLPALHGCPDKDHDGIADRNDRCPNDSGLAVFHGCPDKDGDSIPDIEDKCAALKGSRLHHGCPDTDGDGIFDDQDKCVTQAGPAENHGCPYGDMDGDSVTDNIDQCPQTPGPKSNHGCPVIEKQVQKVINTAISDLEFENNKDVIIESSFTSLDQLADILQKNPEMKLYLAGHTDNVGKPEFNMELSRKRALAVKNYLINKGISEDRITFEYFGSTRPVAPNTTPEGRARNRRVEMKLRFD